MSIQKDTRRRDKKLQEDIKKIPEVIIKSTRGYNKRFKRIQ